MCKDSGGRSSVASCLTRFGRDFITKNKARDCLMEEKTIEFGLWKLRIMAKKKKASKIENLRTRLKDFK